ncbi:hypothetical protein CJF32_00006478 [Rutstroemia sp. NJR-2017a WRK4]|nr:hypothetical protein CJF32_00006478 [Rutstroemia sp. NJR-2017a WRK4]
MQVMSCKHISI